MKARFLLAAALLLGAAITPAEAERNDAVALIDIGDDIRDDARSAAQRGLPLLILFSAEHCPYCVRVEEEFLKPMLLSGEYTERVLIRRIDLDRGFAPMTGFEGETLRADALAARYGIVVTPTLVFVDAAGRPLAEKLVGLLTPDFYGGYIDDRIAEARAALAAR